MSHQLLSNAEIGYFLENRKKLDDVIGQILGPNIHLHDISQQSQSSNNEIQKQIPIILSPTSNRKSGKVDDFFANVSNENKMQKLYKEKVDLQKKLMDAKAQNQTYKQNASLWQKMKQYIVTNVQKQIKLKSVGYGLSDSAILQEFITVLENLLPGSKGYSSARTIKLDQAGQNNESYRNLYEEVKKKLEDESKKSSKLIVEKEALENENKMFRQKQDRFKLQRIARISQIEEGIQQKFQEIQKSLHQKTEQNKFLQKKIVSLESQIFELRGNLSPLRNKDRTISTNAETNIDKNQLDFLKQLSKTKDGQINNLKQQSRTLLSQVSALKSHNEKMKSVIKLAQTLNNEFINKVEQAIKRNNTYNGNIASDYQIGGLYNGNGNGNGKKNANENCQQFHFVNQRFKLVKSRSLEKQKFMYGHKNRI